MRHYDYYMIILFCGICGFYLLSIGEKDLANMFFGVVLSFFGAVLGTSEKKPAKSESQRRDF